MKKYILDTDICSYILKRKPLSVLEKFSKVGTDNVFISVITYAELMYGVEKTKTQRINKEVIHNFLNFIKILEWDIKSAIEYGEIRNSLEVSGVPIGNMDLMIASHAKSLGFVLVTNNFKHFSRIKGLVLENWV